MRIPALLVLCALLPGCSSMKHVCEGGASAPRLRPLLLSVKILDEKKAKGHRVLKRGETAKSGEQYHLSIEVPEKAYVYVLQQSTGGTRQQLWPEASAAPAPWNPAATLTVPREGVLQLDTTTGTEVIYVVASLAPLSNERLDEEVRNAPEAREPEESSKKGVKQPPDEGRRGDEQEGPSKTDRRSEQAFACADARGILAMRFWFKHE